MTKSEAADLARTCRAQAQLASTDEARKVLTELSERYEREGAPPSVGRPVRRAGKRKRLE